MRLMLETLGLLRSLFFTLPLFYLCTTVLGVVSLLLSPINPRARRQHEYSRLWGRLLLIICGVRVHVRGLEKLDPARHYVYLANHRSYLDIPILFARLPGEFRTMAKASLFHLPFWAGTSAAPAIFPSPARTSTPTPAACCKPSSASGQTSPCWFSPKPSAA